MEADERGESEVEVLGVYGRAGAREERFQLEQVVHAIYVGSIGCVAYGVERIGE